MCTHPLAMPKVKLVDLGTPTPPPQVALWRFLDSRDLLAVFLCLCVGVQAQSKKAKFFLLLDRRSSWF